MNRCCVMLVTVALVALGTLLVGCGGGDGGQSSSPLVGTWRMTDQSEDQNLTFNGDGTWTHNDRSMLESGTYTASDSTLQITIQSSTDPDGPVGSVWNGTYSISGDTLTIVWQDQTGEASVWTRQ